MSNPKHPEDLPRLTDEDREALDDEYAAVAGVPVGHDPLHTPGPWVVIEGPAFTLRVTANVLGGEAICYLSNNGQTIESLRANARLIALAPGLLSALRDLVDDDTTPERNCSCHISPPCNDCVEYAHRRALISEAKALIAKAEAQS